MSKNDYRDSLWSILIEIKAIFDRVGCPFFLIAGTLLGAVRDGYLIPWDYDVDVGVFEKDENLVNKVFNECKKEGFGISERWCNSIYTKEVAIYKGNLTLGKYIDVFFFYPHKNTYYACCEVGWCEVYPKEYIDDLRQIVMRGVIFNVPNEPEKCLELQYGNNWKEPLLKGWSGGGLKIKMTELTKRGYQFKPKISQKPSRYHPSYKPDKKYNYPHP